MDPGGVNDHTYLELLELGAVHFTIKESESNI